MNPKAFMVQFVLLFLAYTIIGYYHPDVYWFIRALAAIGAVEIFEDILEALLLIRRYY